MELAQGGSIADLIKERKDLVSRFDEDDIWRGARYSLLLYYCFTYIIQSSVYILYRRELTYIGAGRSIYSAASAPSTN
jgi:hypothetical protein